MSTWLTQLLMYGVKLPTKVYETWCDNHGFDRYADEHHAWNTENGLGWYFPDREGYVILGKVLKAGDNWGNDSIIAVDEGIYEIRNLTEQEIDEVGYYIHNTLNPEMKLVHKLSPVISAKTYIVVHCG